MKKYFPAATVSSVGEASGAQCRKAFSDGSRFLQKKRFTQTEPLLITIKLSQSTAEET